MAASSAANELEQGRERKFALILRARTSHAPEIRGKRQAARLWEALKECALRVAVGAGPKNDDIRREVRRRQRIHDQNLKPGAAFQRTAYEIAKQGRHLDQQYPKIRRIVVARRHGLDRSGCPVAAP